MKSNDKMYSISYKSFFLHVLVYISYCTQYLRSLPLWSRYNVTCAEMRAHCQPIREMSKACFGTHQTTSIPSGGFVIQIAGIKYHLSSIFVHSALLVSFVRQRWNFSLFGRRKMTRNTNLNKEDLHSLFLDSVFLICSFISFATFPYFT
jgi:hypothetical protein